MKRFLCVMAVALGSVIARAQLPGDIIRAQVPEIHELVPVTPRAGQVVRIFGQNFDRVPTNNTVHFGAAKARVLRSWVSELEVELPGGIQPGPVTVVVSNKLAMSQVPFQPIFAPYGSNTPVYLKRFTFEGARHPAAVDLDNDGDLELVLARQPDGIEVYKYVGSGPLLDSSSFTLALRLSGLTNTASIRAMDLKSDGKYDLLVSSTNSGGKVIANIHQGGELGTNSLGISSLAPASPVSDFFDVDRDGTLDLITWNGSTVRAFRGIPAGGHEAYSTAPVDLIRQNATSMAIADLNRDGHLDVVTLDSQNLTIHSHDGRMGIFGSFLQLSIPAQSLAALQVADIEGDGWPDILAFNRATRKCEVFWNRNIGGHLSAADFTRVTLVPEEISVLITPRLVDLDGDTFPDLVTRSFGYHKNESALLRDLVFSGTFAPTNRFEVSFASPTGFITADLNSDGQPEIITSEGEVYQNISAIAPLISAVEHTRSFDPVASSSIVLHMTGHADESVVLQGSADLNVWRDLRTMRLDSRGKGNWGVPLETHARFFKVAH